MINNEWYAALGKQKTRYLKQLSVKPQPSQKRTGMMAEVESEVTSYDMQGSTRWRGLQLYKKILLLDWFW